MSSTSKRIDIPERSSSLVAEDLLDKHAKKQRQIRDLRCSINESQTFDAQFYRSQLELAGEEKALLNLKRQISQQSLRSAATSTEEWEEEERSIQANERLQNLYEKLFRARQERLSLSNRNPELSIRRAFVDLFTKSKQGLNWDPSGAKKRDRQIQRDFRSTLIEASNAEHPDKEIRALWNPISQSYLNKDIMVAAHIFSNAHGQDMMHAIFGMAVGETDELFTPRNGMLLDRATEKAFARGQLAFVPFIKDMRSHAEVANWSKAETKEYKICILDPRLLVQPLPWDHNGTFRDVDGRKLEFKSNHRPRTRYLYFMYCMAMLRRCHENFEDKELLLDHNGRPIWATPGPYIRKAMLAAIAEEVGHEELMQGAIQPDGDSEKGNEVEKDDLALLACNDAIRMANEEYDDEDSDEDSDY